MPSSKPKSRARSRRRSQPTAEGLGADDAVVASEPVESPTPAEAAPDAPLVEATDAEALPDFGDAPLASPANRGYRHG